MAVKFSCRRRRGAGTCRRPKSRHAGLRGCACRFGGIVGGVWSYPYAQRGRFCSVTGEGNVTVGISIETMNVRHKRADAQTFFARELDATKYGTAFDADINGKRPTDVEAYEWLDKAGFDQIPTGSNFSCDTNFADTVKFCDAHCNQDRLKGYMMAPWTRTFAIHEEKSMQAISQMAEAIKARKA